MVHIPFKSRNLIFGGRHCERTMFVFFGTLAVFSLLLLFFIVGQLDINLGMFTSIDGTEFTIGPMEIVLISGVFVFFAYLGVIYYRHEKNKKPLFIWKFWKAER